MKSNRTIHTRKKLVHFPYSLFGSLFVLFLYCTISHSRIKKCTVALLTARGCSRVHFRSSSLPPSCFFDPFPPTRSRVSPPPLHTNNTKRRKNNKQPCSVVLNRKNNREVDSLVAILSRFSYWGGRGFYHRYSRLDVICHRLGASGRPVEGSVKTRT